MLEIAYQCKIWPKFATYGVGELSKSLEYARFPQALKIMENLENHEKSSMHGKTMEFKKKQHLNNHGEIIEFCEIIIGNH